MQIFEDRQLIRRFKAGDSSALARIYEKYKNELLKLAIVLVNDVNTAEDVVHEVFLNFSRSISRIQPRGNLKGYLAASVVNGIRNQRRNHARSRLCDLSDADYMPDEAKRPEQWAVLSEQFQLLAAAMAQLPQEQRQAVALRMDGGMNYKQIAEIQNTSSNTVRGRYRYGIERLRSILNGKVTK